MAHPIDAYAFIGVHVMLDNGIVTHPAV
jgi:hypothetical protein